MGCSGRRPIYYVFSLSFSMSEMSVRKSLSGSSLIDTSTPIGKLMLTMIGAINEFERMNLLERQREGIQCLEKYPCLLLRQCRCAEVLFTLFSSQSLPFRLVLLYFGSSGKIRKSPENHCFQGFAFGLGEKIRTSGLLNPIQRIVLDFTAFYLYLYTKCTQHKMHMILEEY